MDAKCYLPFLVGTKIASRKYGLTTINFDHILFQKFFINGMDCEQKYYINSNCYPASPCDAEIEGNCTISMDIFPEYNEGYINLNFYPLEDVIEWTVVLKNGKTFISTGTNTISNVAEAAILETDGDIEGYIIISDGQDCIVKNYFIIPEKQVCEESAITIIAQRIGDNILLSVSGTDPKVEYDYLWRIPNKEIFYFIAEPNRNITTIPNPTGFIVIEEEFILDVIVTNPITGCMRFAQILIQYESS